MTDQAIEQEIQAKGLTAPRVTPADLQANIISERYLNLGYGLEATGWKDVGKNDPTRLITLCVLVLRNGFTVTGESACASPENYDAAIGYKVARENAVQKNWPLMGYALRQHLHDAPAKRIRVCGVDCHQGDDKCNGYCIGKAPHAVLIGQ